MRLLLLSLNLDAMCSFLPPPARIAFVPTAGDVYDNPTFVERDRKLLMDLRYHLHELPISSCTRHEIEDSLSVADGIFVAGGNTFYLLQEMIRSGFADIIQRRVHDGLSYIGASAGAVVAGPSLLPIVGLDDQSKAPALQSLDSLALVDFIVLPHYNEKSKDTYDKIVATHGSRFTILPLTDDDSIVVEGTSVTRLTSASDPI